MRDAIVRRPKAACSRMDRASARAVGPAPADRREDLPGDEDRFRSLLHSYYRMVAADEPLPPIHDSGFRVFSQFDEDGVILYLLGAGGIGTRRFVDLGAGDGVYASNCANLALNLGFDGVFVEADAAKARARPELLRATSGHARASACGRPRVRHRENVNDLVRAAGFEGEIDLLSIDVDGNDYWLLAGARLRQPALRRRRSTHRARARGLRDAV